MAGSIEGLWFKAVFELWGCSTDNQVAISAVRFEQTLVVCQTSNIFSYPAHALDVTGKVYLPPPSARVITKFTCLFVLMMKLLDQVLVWL